MCVCTFVNNLQTLPLRSTCFTVCKIHLNLKDSGDFPGGAVDKSWPANTGVMSLIPGLGRSHMLQDN